MSETIFRWETLREVGDHPLNTRPPIAGRLCEVELIGGETITVWRADDGVAYFCHGLTFRGVEAPGGPVSPLTGRSVEIILRGYYALVESEPIAKSGDILVWSSPDPFLTTPHSAILVAPIPMTDSRQLDYSSSLRTKNGMRPETTMSLEDLVGEYGETYRVYRKK